MRSLKTPSLLSLRKDGGSCGIFPSLPNSAHHEFRLHDFTTPAHPWILENPDGRLSLPCLLARSSKLGVFYRHDRVARKYEQRPNLGGHL
jgi:hypothetical protein